MTIKLRGRYALLLCLLLLLTALFGAAGCGGSRSMGENSIGLEPLSVSVSVGQQQRFSASVIEGFPDKISWKVQEGDVGGTVVVVPQEGYALDQVVVYTAPQTKGVYHVQATATFNNGGRKTMTNTATVEVK